MQVCARHCPGYGPLLQCLTVQHHFSCYMWWDICGIIGALITQNCNCVCMNVCSNTHKWQMGHLHSYLTLRAFAESDTAHSDKPKVKIRIRKCSCMKSMRCCNSVFQPNMIQHRLILFPTGGFNFYSSSGLMHPSSESFSFGTLKDITLFFFFFF